MAQTARRAEPWERTRARALGARARSGACPCLCALEQYLGREVIRAPYPGIMGAIGMALITKEQYHAEQKQTFIGLDALDSFSYKRESNLPCPFCTNHCQRTIVTFSNGNSWITNNRCERGEILGDPKDAKVREKIKEVSKESSAVPNLFEVREKLLFEDYPYPQLLPAKETVIGIPRVLSYWETMPFWNTFFRALGYQVRISDKSTQIGRAHV